MSVLKQYQRGDVLVSAGTLSTAPLVQPVGIGNVYLKAIHLRIPAGHQGFTGIAWQQSGSQVVPWGSGIQYVIDDNQYFVFDYDNQVGADFQVTAYNTDLFDHTFYVRYELYPLSVIPAADFTSLVAIS